MLAKVQRVFASLQRQGLYDTINIFTCRYKKKQFIAAARSAAAAPSFTIAKKHAGAWLRSRSLSYLDTLVPHDTKLVQQAAPYVQDQFAVLGASWYPLDDAMWHTDIRLKQQGGIDYQFPLSFYADIAIPTASTKDKGIAKDIKVPWELSRLQHLVLLGKAYEQIGDSAYVATFMRHVQHWSEHNPYLYGVNWLCPMEVGLRAINLIVASEYFKHADIPDAFWQEYAAQLYAHMAYLEHNWEWYDGRTNNHYLSNLVGYLYLLWFFQEEESAQKSKWCQQELSKEVLKQVFPEGTSYEGSTAYHRLVTELLEHADRLLKQMGMPFDPEVQTRIAKMFQFIADVSYADGKIVTIGDDDSGSVLFNGLPHQLLTQQPPQQGITIYPDFGLRIYQDERMHVTVRHHAYQPAQPTGHFHNDVGSITLAYKGRPILVDPGSYLYTASGYWRNRFRSSQTHSTVSVALHEPVPFDDEQLFALALPPSDNVQHDYKKTLHVRNRLYARYGLNLYRAIHIQDNALFINDICQRSAAERSSMKINISFLFDPHITLKKDGCAWVLFAGLEPVAQFESELLFEEQTMWVAPGYGTKQAASCLRTVMPIAHALSAVHSFKFML